MNLLVCVLVLAALASAEEANNGSPESKTTVTVSVQPSVETEKYNEKRGVQAISYGGAQQQPEAAALEGGFPGAHAATAGTYSTIGGGYGAEVDFRGSTQGNFQDTEALTGLEEAQGEFTGQGDSFGGQGIGQGLNQGISQVVDQAVNQGVSQGHGSYEHQPHQHRIKSVTITKEIRVPVPKPYPVPVIKKIPVPVPHPVPVHVDKPYPVHVPVKVPFTVIKHVPYPVEKPVPYHIHVPVKVPVPSPVPIHVPKPVPYTVHVPVKVPVAKPYPVIKPVPIIIKSHHHHHEHQDHQHHHQAEQASFGAADGVQGGATLGADAGITQANAYNPGASLQGYHAQKRY